MDNTNLLVLELSSDEEDGFMENRRDFGDKEEYDWLLELLDEDPKNLGLVGEGVVNPPNTPALQAPGPFSKVSVKESGGGGGGDDDDDDDDCVVLDGDPDKVVMKGDDTTAIDNDEDDDSDDLKIVGEKGEVACRDFPHSRHLCAKFPLASNPHAVHCNQCHCYVCDSLAPCAHWGTGSCSTDHCHASDKDDYWKEARRNRQKGDKHVQVTPTIVAGPQQATHALPLAPSQFSCLLPNQRVWSMDPCSISSNVVNQNRSNPLGCNPSRYIPPPPPSQLVRPQFHHPCNNNFTDKTHNAGNRSSQSFPPRAVFKRTGYSRNYNGFQSYRHIQTPGLDGFRGPNQRNIRSYVNNSMSSQQRVSPSMDVRCPNYMPPPQPPISSLQIRDPVTTQPQIQIPFSLYQNRNFVNMVPFRPQVASQPFAGNFGNMFLPQPDLVFQPNYSLPSQNLASQSHTGNSAGNQLPAISNLASNLNLGSQYENMFSQPHDHNNPTPLLINGQNDFQQGTQTGVASTSVDFGFDFDGSTSHVNAQDLSDICQLGSAASADNHDKSITTHVDNSHQQSVALVGKFHQENVAQLEDLPLNDSDLHSPGTKDPGIVDLPYDNWFFENNPLPGTFESSLSPNWNTFSPEPAFIDSGNFFDY